MTMMFGFISAAHVATASESKVGKEAKTQRSMECFIWVNECSGEQAGETAKRAKLKTSSAGLHRIDLVGRNGWNTSQTSLGQSGFEAEANKHSHILAGGLTLACDGQGLAHLLPRRMSDGAQQL